MLTENTTSIEDTLRKLMIKVTHKKVINLTRSATFKDLGADSLAVVHILVAIEDMYGIDIKDEDLKNIVNIGGFVDYVTRKVKEKISWEPNRGSSD
jgi:acyl carrier protein